jgi:hypothetical protein
MLWNRGEELCNIQTLRYKSKLSLYPYDTNYSVIVPTCNIAHMAMLTGIII